MIRALLLLLALGVQGVSAGCPRPSAKDFKSRVIWKVPEGFEAMQVEVLDDGRILVASRLGKVVEVDRTGGGVREILDLPVEGEGASSTLGLFGIAAAPGPPRERRIYLYYAPAGKPYRYRLSRFTLEAEGLVDERVVLEIPRENLPRDHTGGSLDFDGQGNLFLSTGDNTLASASSGFSPIDDGPNQTLNDAQRSAGNTDDLRGKILRIRPLDAPPGSIPGPGSTYAIPEGNLREAFASLWPGDLAAKVRPEIYTMGHRNPFRIAVDRRRGWVNWGEVGPDAKDPSEGRGPVGHDEFNVAIRPGNFGWPYFVGNNLPYRRFDFGTGRSGDWFDPAAPENRSPRNTGVTLLPPARPPMVAMDKRSRVLVPDGSNLGSSWGYSGAAIGGAFFDAALVDPSRSEGALPAWYHGRLFIAEFIHRWIRTARLDDTGGLDTAEPFLPNLRHTRIIDLEIPSDGSLYVLEWGNAYQPNDNLGKLMRITYHGPYPDPAGCGVTPFESRSFPRPIDLAEVPRLRMIRPGLRLDVPRSARRLQLIATDGRVLWSAAWPSGETPRSIEIPRDLGLRCPAWVDFLPRPPWRYPWRSDTRPDPATAR